MCAWVVRCSKMEKSNMALALFVCVALFVCAGLFVVFV